MSKRNVARFPNGQFAPRDWKIIESSNLEAGAWVPQRVVAFTEVGRLYVEFKGGAIYRYDDVPEGDLDIIVTEGQSPEGSAGHTFHELIKLAEFPYERVV